MLDLANIFFTTVVSIVIVLTMYLFARHHFVVKKRAARLLDLKSCFADKSLVFERAKDLFLISESYFEKANTNNAVSVVILFALSIFVALPGAILNQDTPRFASVAQLQEVYQTAEIRSSKDDSEKAKQGFLDAQSNYLSALQAQLRAEEGVSAPIYRVSASMLIRVAVIGVAIYLVVLLNRAFKHNNAISSIYRARYNSVLRGDDNLEDFAKYTALITAEHVDYDVDIEHPVTKILTFFEKVLTAVKSTVVSKSGVKT